MRLFNNFKYKKYQLVYYRSTGRHFIVRNRKHIDNTNYYELSSVISSKHCLNHITFGFLYYIFGNNIKNKIIKFIFNLDCLIYYYYESDIWTPGMLNWPLLNNLVKEEDLKTKDEHYCLPMFNDKIKPCSNGGCDFVNEFLNTPKRVLIKNEKLAHTTKGSAEENINLFI